MIAAQARFIPYPGCVETLLPRVIHKTINDCRNTPDEGFPHLSNKVTIFLKNPENSVTIFERFDLYSNQPGRFSSSSETVCR